MDLKRRSFQLSQTMRTKETLSSKITWCPSATGVRMCNVIEDTDVKQFIKDLKEEFRKHIIVLYGKWNNFDEDFMNQIDTLAGEELLEESS